MRPRQAKRVKSLASAIALALLLRPFAFAQEPSAPQATTNQSQTVAPSPQLDVAEGTEPPSANQSLDDQIPDSPGTVQTRANNPQATLPSSAPADSNPSSEAEPSVQEAQVSPQSSKQISDTPSQASTQPPAQSPQQQQQTPHEPVGTAAAESVPITGVAASRPAGAAVAPAKQRRARSILIKVGALVGAGVAIGTTMALSQGSPSKPPGSH